MMLEAASAAANMREYVRAYACLVCVCGTIAHAPAVKPRAIERGVSYVTKFQIAVTYSLQENGPIRPLHTRVASRWSRRRRVTCRLALGAVEPPVARERETKERRRENST